ncbi:hypothetical protein Leryth_007909 [Lithospermum erythrorhizon]|nr:hypothetical protein Leryth_007909 [Lithospermum erythrorhizon]
MSDNACNEHIVMLPMMAQGHLIPFLGLAKQINQTSGIQVTIVSTPLNINYLNSTISKDSTQSSSGAKINLVALPFKSEEHGLPPNCENTEAIPLHQIALIFHASTFLEVPFRSFLQDLIAKDGKAPLCIVSDVFMGWANEVAKCFGTINVTFSTGGAYGTAAYASIWQHLPHRLTDKEEFNVPGFPDSCYFHISQLHKFIRDADGTDIWSRFFQPQIANSLKSFGFLVNTVEEIEPLGLDILRKYVNMPVWCIGPLLPSTMLLDQSGSTIIGQRTGRVPGVSPEKCIQWLDNHSGCSVLYISFGSQNTVSPSQMMALAMGLEESGQPFIWVIRPPFGYDLRGEFRPEWLPEGFEKRVAEKKQGLLVHRWAPQLEILCHKSTGAFLTHCGWNSVMESLSQGVPLIGWPLAAEQGYNSKMLVENMEVCIVLAKGVQGNLDKEDVKRVISIVMDKGGKGGEMKKNAVKIGELIRSSMKDDVGGKKGSSLQAMDDFVSTLLSLKNREAP